MIDTKQALVFTYAHLPEKFQFLSYPPKDITKNKYSDLKYLKRVYEMIEELKESDFNTRSDKVLPYSKNIILGHIKRRIDELKVAKRGNSE